MVMFVYLGHTVHPPAGSPASISLSAAIFVDVTEDVTYISVVNELSEPRHNEGGRGQ